MTQNEGLALAQNEAINIYMMVVEQNMTPEQVAEELGITLTSVDILLHMASIALKQKVVN